MNTTIIQTFLYSGELTGAELDRTGGLMRRYANTSKRGVVDQGEGRRHTEGRRTGREGGRRGELKNQGWRVMRRQEIPVCSIPTSFLPSRRCCFFHSGARHWAGSCESLVNGCPVMKFLQPLCCSLKVRRREVTPGTRQKPHPELKQTTIAGLRFAVSQAPTSARNIEEMSGVQYLRQIKVKKNGSEAVQWRAHR